MEILAKILGHARVAKAAFEEQREQAAEGASVATGREREFLPAALEVMETPASPLGRAIVYAIIGFFVIAITWAVIGEIDIVASSQGKIIPTERVKVIQPRDAGVIRAINVTDGQTVLKGDVLIELDPTDAAADRDRLSDQLATARVNVERLRALVADNPLAAFKPPAGTSSSLVRLQRSLLASQVEERRTRRVALDGEVIKRRAEIETIKAGISRLQRILPTIRERVEGRRKLLEKGIIAKLAFAELEAQLFDHEGQLKVQRRKLEESRAALQAVKAQRDQLEAEFRRQTMGEMAEAHDRAAGAEQEYIKAEERSRLQTLTAPVDGTVQQLAVHTVGGVVTPAQQLMVVVPAHSRLEIEALVLNKDIGFVHAGQDAELKVESFPFTKYGTIDGTILHVSADAISDERVGLVYPARVAMARATIRVDDKEVKLSPGMSVTVEIKTGKRQIIDFLLAPLQRYQDESLTER